MPVWFYISPRRVPNIMGELPTKAYFFRGIKKKFTAPDLSNTEQVLRITMEKHAARDVKGPPSQANKGVCFI